VKFPLEPSVPLIKIVVTGASKESVKRGLHKVVPDNAPLADSEAITV
jgi:hypothetical protein